MSHQIEANESMHTIEFLFINIILLLLGNVMIETTPIVPVEVVPFDFWEMIHKLGYFVPFIGLCLSQKKTILCWFKKRKSR